MASDTQIKSNSLRHCKLSEKGLFITDDSCLEFDPAIADNINLQDIFDCDGYLKVNNQLPSGFVFDNGEFENVRWVLHNPCDWLSLGTCRKNNTASQNKNFFQVISQCGPTSYGPNFWRPLRSR
jgi:hypothetical protein